MICDKRSFFVNSVSRRRFFSSMLAVIFFFTTALFFLPGKTNIIYSDPGWLNDWSKRIQLTIRHEHISEDLVNFPLMVYLSESSGRNEADLSLIFNEIGANARKIAFTTSDGTTHCNAEIERWDSASERAWIWVRVPFIDSSADTTLYLYYDNDQPDNPLVNFTGTSAAQDVWSNNYQGVWHMQDQNSSLVPDSSGNANSGSKQAANQPQEVGGVIGRGQFFDGVDDYISFGNNNLNQQLSGAGGITLSTWINPSSLASGGIDDRNVIFDIPIGNELSAIKMYLFDNGRLGVGGMSIEDDGFRFIEHHESVVNSGNWYHLSTVLNFSGNSITAYLDGQPLMSGVSNFDSNFYC